MTQVDKMQILPQLANTQQRLVRQRATSSQYYLPDLWTIRYDPLNTLVGQLCT